MKRHRFVLCPGERPWEWRPFGRRWQRIRISPYAWGQCGICGLDFEAAIHRLGRRR